MTQLKLPTGWWLWITRASEIRAVTGQVALTVQARAGPLPVTLPAAILRLARSSPSVRNAPGPEAVPYVHRYARLGP